MRALGLAVIGWSLVVVAFVLLNPFGQGGTLACMQLLARTADCTALQDSVNQAFWLDRTLPTILAIAAGYVAIVAVRLGRARLRQV
jgi:hypothetical protein